VHGMGAYRVEFQQTPCMEIPAGDQSSSSGLSSRLMFFPNFEYSSCRRHLDVNTRCTHSGRLATARSCPSRWAGSLGCRATATLLLQSLVTSTRPKVQEFSVRQARSTRRTGTRTSSLEKPPGLYQVLGATTACLRHVAPYACKYQMLCSSDQQYVYLALAVLLLSSWERTASVKQQARENTLRAHACSERCEDASPCKVTVHLHHARPCVPRSAATGHPAQERTALSSPICVAMSFC
jgi:hypothetical protein